MVKLERWRNYLAQCSAYHEQDLYNDIHDAILPDDGPRNGWHGESR